MWVDAVTVDASEVELADKEFLHPWALTSIPECRTITAFSKARLQGPAVAVKGSPRRASPPSTAPTGRSPAHTTDFEFQKRRILKGGSGPHYPFGEIKGKALAYLVITHRARMLFPNR